MFAYAFPLAILAAAAAVSITYLMLQRKIESFSHEGRETRRVSSRAPSRGSLSAFAIATMIAVLGSVRGVGDPLVFQSIDKELGVQSLAGVLLALGYGYYAIWIAIRNLARWDYLRSHKIQIEGDGRAKQEAEARRLLEESAQSERHRADEAEAAAQAARAEAEAARAQLAALRAGDSPEPTPSPQPTEDSVPATDRDVIHLNAGERRAG